MGGAPGGGRTDCLTMTGQLALNIANVTTYEANETATKNAIASGLSAALGVNSGTVTILQIRGWTTDWTTIETLSNSQSQGPGAPVGGRRMEAVETLATTQGGQSTPRRMQSYSLSLYNDTVIVDSTGISLIKFLISSLPVTLLPDSIPGRAATLATQIDTEFGNGTVSSAQFTPWPAVFASIDMVAQEMKRQYMEYEESQRQSSKSPAPTPGGLPPGGPPKI